MDQYKLEAGTVDMRNQGYRRRSLASSFKLRLSRQTWMILLVMVCIMVAWKSRRSLPAKSVNSSKQEKIHVQREEKPARLEVNHITEEFQGSTMEDELSSGDILSSEDDVDLKFRPTLEDQENTHNHGAHSKDEDFSTPTDFAISEDMLSTEDSKGHGGADKLIKDVMDTSVEDSLNSDDSDDATYSTPTSFDDDLDKDMLSSDNSIDDVHLEQEVTDNEESKEKDVENTYEDDKISTPTDFDIETSSKDETTKESIKEEEKVSEPSGTTAKNAANDIEIKGADVASNEQSQDNVEVMTNEETNKQEKEDKPSEEGQENGNGVADNEEPKKEESGNESIQAIQENHEKDLSTSDDSKTDEDMDENEIDVLPNDGQIRDSEGNILSQHPEENDKGIQKKNGEENIELIPQKNQEINEELEGDNAKSVNKEGTSQKETLGNVEYKQSEQQSNGSSANCFPHHHIMFLKTHKCASSTVQNILLRYGYQNDLFFALSAGHYLGHPRKFNYHMMSRNLLPASGKADILTLHSRLNIPEHKKAMYPDAKWITIVRDPVKQFESLFNYYELYKFYKMDLATFLNQSVEVLRTAPRWNGKHGRNTMLFDMGYQDTASPEELKGIIKTMDDLFHYVMIADRMDESLILLRNQLCWTNHDIIGFTKNARIKENKTLSDDLMGKINQMNMEDTAIYNYFLNKHMKLVESYGIDKMAEEVGELQELRQKYYDFCVAEEVLGHDKRLKGNQEWKPSANAYLPNNNNGTCTQIIMKETSFITLVRNHQKVLIKRLTEEKK